MAVLGLGKDMWEVPFPNISDILFVSEPPTDVTPASASFLTFAQYFWIDEFLYIATLSATKISILLLYLRIFPSTVSHRFRIAIFALIGVVACYFIILEFLILFSCNPISYFWHQWDGEHQGHCFNTNAQIFAGAAVNIALDIVVLVLPIPKIMKIDVSYKKRIGIVLTFFVGGFSIICSIVRLQSLSSGARRPIRPGTIRKSPSGRRSRAWHRSFAPACPRWQDRSSACMAGQ